MVRQKYPFTVAVVGVSALAMLAGLIYMNVAAEKSQTDLKATLEDGLRCERLRPAMTRDEVMQIMGPPSKEYDVKPEGRGGEAMVREMLYPAAGAKEPAFVDLDPASARVIEINCRSGYRLTASSGEIEKVLAAENRPVAADAAIPLSR